MRRGCATVRKSRSSIDAHCNVQRTLNIQIAANADGAKALRCCEDCSFSGAQCSIEVFSAKRCKLSKKKADVSSLHHVREPRTGANCQYRQRLSSKSYFGCSFGYTLSSADFLIVGDSRSFFIPYYLLCRIRSLSIGFFSLYVVSTYQE